MREIHDLRVNERRPLINERKLFFEYGINKMPLSDYSERGIFEESA